MTNNKVFKMSDIVLVKYLFQTDWEPLDEVIQANSNDFGDIYEVDNEKEVIQVAKSSSATLILACVKNKDDLTKVLNFFKLSKKILKDSNIKISVVNFLQNKSVEAAFMKLGCQEVLDPSLKAKPLKFKMDFWKKSLSVGMTKKTVEQNKTVKDSRTDKDGDKKDAPQIKWNEPLKVVDDMWITKNPQDTKRVLNRWMIKLMGPSPFVAQWIEVDGQKGLWQFVFKEGAREKFHMADGDWFYRGEQKPEFVWKENLWLVSGHKIQLFYQEDDKVVARFRTNQEHLEICKNSNYALSREKAIIETFDQEVLVKNGVVDKSKTSVETDQKTNDGKLTQDLDGNDHIDGHLSGKNSKEKAIKDKKHNVGRDDLNLDNLQGEGGTDDLGGANLSGKVERQNKQDKEEKEKKTSSARADALFDETGDAGTENVGPKKYKGKLEHGRSDRKSDYGGAFETDDLGKAHYSGKISKNASSSQGDGNDAIDEHFEGTDLTTSFKNSHPQGKINDRRPSELDDLDVAEDDDEGQLEDIVGAHGKSLREKKIKSIDDLLPDGNAEDPLEELLPKASPNRVNKEAEIKQNLAQESESPKEARKQPNLQLVSNEEAPALNDEGKPIVAESAKVRAYVERLGAQKQEWDVHVDDFFENTAILKMQSKELQVNEMVNLVVVFEYMKKTKKISVQGKCIETQHDDEESYVTVEMNEQNQKIFEQFMRLYQLRQEHVTEFLKAARGY